MRVFLAVEFPESVKEYLFHMQQVVRKISRSGHFTDRDNFHLTLRFIGETGTEDRKKLKQAIEAAARKREPFPITLQGLGHFPRGSEHIIWIGLQNSNALRALYDCLETELETYGYPKERNAYTPHITLGREVALDGNFAELAHSVSAESMIVPVSRISLMQSTRTNRRLNYVPLYTKEL